MEKQKLAEMVLERMKKKKEEEERNRPHHEVLRLQVTFEQENNSALKSEIAILEQILQEEKGTLKQLESHLQDLDNTGKRNYPRIIVMPDFIASEHVQADVKAFYRKASNSFLRNDILRNKNFSQSVLKEKEYLQNIREVQELEADLRAKSDRQRKILNDKRVKVLKEDLRLRSIREEQRKIKQTIQLERYENKDLLHEYELKRLNLDNRKEHLKKVGEQIQAVKGKIEETYNPISYRKHLQNIFDIEIKTQTMQKHLIQVTQNVHSLERQTQKFERTLERAASLTVLGRTSDSPSTRRGKIQKRLQGEKEQSKQQGHRRSASAMSKAKLEQTPRPKSQNSVRPTVGELDLSKIGSTAKQSQWTTDRSSHPRAISELSRPLF